MACRARSRHLRCCAGAPPRITPEKGEAAKEKATLSLLQQGGRRRRDMIVRRPAGCSGRGRAPRHHSMPRAVKRPVGRPAGSSPHRHRSLRRLPDSSGAGAFCEAGRCPRPDLALHPPALPARGVLILFFLLPGGRCPERISPDDMPQPASGMIHRPERSGEPAICLPSMLRGAAPRSTCLAFPRTTCAKRDLQAARTAMVLVSSLAAGTFGNRTVRMPFANTAPIAPRSMSSGRRKERANVP